MRKINISKIILHVSQADNCKISKKTAVYGTRMKFARNEEETHTSDFR